MVSKRTARRSLAAACIVFAVLAGVAGCEEQAPSGQPDTTPSAALTEPELMIKAELDKLLTRDGGAFLVISSDEGKMLVQFTGSKHEELLADLPLKWLNDQELSAARQVFAQAGATPEQMPTRNAGEMFPTFSLKLGKDTEAAARLTSRLLKDAYKLSPTDELVFETEDD